MRIPTTSAILLLALAAATGCSSRDADSKESDINELAATGADLTLARKAVDLIAGDDAHCTSCHTASKTDIRRWGTALKAVETSCLDPALSLTAAQRVACLSDDPANPSSPFSATKLGLYSAAATHASIKGLFASDAQSTARYAALLEQAAMPKNGARSLTEAQFATVKKWVLAGMPALDELLANPELADCVPSSTPELAQHLAEMKSTGWGARLGEGSVPMAGCPAGADATACLANLPDVTQAIGQNGVAQTVRKLRDVPGGTDFWVRSSADGRYTAVGGPGRVFDNASGPSGAPIKVDAPYDPTFFPNNDGFGYAGTNGGITVCKQSVLDHARDTAPHKVTFREAGCSSVGDSVYQSIGAALDGAVYWMSTGDHVNDYGGEGTPPEGFGATAATTLTPMVSNGTTYKKKADVELQLPYEGDQVLSPSSRLLVTRFGSTAGKRGFKIRRLTWTASGGAFTVKTKDLGTVCVNATKPIVSFDERFIVTHQYVDKAENTGLPDNTSNIVLSDLATGEVVRLTSMKEHQVALFGHFRADGWIYFLVKDKNTGKETLYASDAAVRRAAALP